MRKGTVAHPPVRGAQRQSIMGSPRPAFLLLAFFAPTVLSARVSKKFLGVVSEKVSSGGVASASGTSKFAEPEPGTSWAPLPFELRDPQFLPALNDAFAGSLWKLNYDGAVNRSALTGLYGVYRVAAKHYEDLPPEGLVDLLQKAGFQPGERFYDLGAGPGKTIALAWMLGLNASGVELSERRVEGACAAFKNLTQSSWAKRGSRGRDVHGELSISAGSFTNFDFSDGDVVLMDVPNIPEMYYMLDQVAPIAMRMREGSRIISQVQLGLPGGRRVVSECNRPAQDEYEAAARDVRLKKYLCGCTYFIYTMPGPSTSRGPEEVMSAPPVDVPKEWKMKAPAARKSMCRF